jgi:tripartite ATP-independent transporter DctM subunit
LSKSKENLDGLKLNAFEGAAFCNFYHPGKDPAFMVFSLPFLPLGDPRVDKYVRGKMMSHPAMIADMARWNAMPYVPGLLPQYELVGKGKPPTKLEDWKGLRVRAGGGLGSAMKMLRYGYDPKLAAGVVAAGGTLASLIPPSAILVIYAIIVEESVGALLLAGFLPGAVSALIYAAIIIFWAKLKPEVGPPVTGFTWGERFKSLPGISPIFLVVAIIMTAIYDGWATPTEAGALGAFVVLCIALFKGMRIRTLRDALMESAKLTVMIFSLIWGVLIFVRFLGFSGLPEAFTEWILALDASPMVIMICILLGYAVLGMFMDAIGMLLLTLPVVYPAVMALGFDSIWFGIIVVKMAEVCLITPPVGLNCFVVNGVRPDISLATIFRGITLFFVADVITIGVLLAFSCIITWLPALLR